MPTIDLYMQPASGPCRAVLMTAQYIGVDVRKILIDLDREDQMKPEYVKMNPQHCVPTINDNGFYLWESRAILAYLVNKYAPDSPLYPRDPQARAMVDRVLYFEIGTLYKAEAEYLYPHLFEGEPHLDPEKEEPFKKALGLLEGFLGKTAYVAADHVTIADYSLLGNLTFAEMVDYSFEPFPRIAAWLRKMKSEVPNYKEINEDPILQYKETLRNLKR